MRKLIWLALLFSIPAHASFVQQVQVSSASSASPQNLPAMTVTAGDCLVLVVAGPKPTDTVTPSGGSFTWAAASGNPQGSTLASAPSSGATTAALSTNWAEATGSYAIAFSDNETRYALFTNGSTAIQWTTPLTASVTTSVNIGTGDGLVAYYEANAPGGSTSVSVTASNNLYGAYLSEYSNCATSGALLAATAGVSGGPGTTTNGIKTDVMSTASVPSNVVGFTLSLNATASTDITAGTGYTARTPVFATYGGYGFPEDQQPGSGTSFTATWTSDSSAQFDGFMSVALAFKASGGSSVHGQLHVIVP